MYFWGRMRKVVHMRITVIDGTTGDVHAVEPAHQNSEPHGLTIDSNAKPTPLQNETASEKPASWKPIRFQDGTMIEVNVESGEIIAKSTV